jgi:hypothetical protein
MFSLPGMGTRRKAGCRSGQQTGSSIIVKEKSGQKESSRINYQYALSQIFLHSPR